MKKLLIIILLVASKAAFAQEKVTLNDLYIPNAPGLTLADKSPASIDKPSTPRAFALSLINLGQGGALEVTPFWLKNKPNYTYDQWLAKKIFIVESFNFSIANYKSEGTFTFAPGIRTQVFRLFLPRTVSALKIQKNILVGLLSVPVPDTAAVNKAKRDLFEIAKKGFFTVDIAAATLGTSNERPLKDLDFTRTGLWTNLRWSPFNFPVGVVGLARYSWAAGKIKSGRDSSFIDFGAGLNYVKDKFDLSAEYVNRKDNAANEHYTRLTLIANYAITDNIILVASSGKDLKAGDELITLFGIKFGLVRSKEK